jgi:hypothetical protein
MKVALDPMRYMRLTFAALLYHLTQLGELYSHFPLKLGSELFCLTGIDEFHRSLHPRAFRKIQPRGMIV